MATIWWEEPIAVSADEAWAALRQVDRAQDLFAPVLVAGAMEGDTRTLTFANGLVVRERIVTVDEDRRRLVYCVLGDMFEQHSASMQILPVDESRCHFLWISDFLPEERMAMQPVVEQGAKALASNLESDRTENGPMRPPNRGR